MRNLRIVNVIMITSLTTQHVIKAIEEQYKDSSYSEFVESLKNSTLFHDYYHCSFFVAKKENPVGAMLHHDYGNYILGHHHKKLLLPQRHLLNL